MKRTERISYMPAMSQAEADSLVVAGFGHDTQEAADRHLVEIKKAQTDPYYGNQYRVYRCVTHPRVDSIKMTGRRAGFTLRKGRA